MTTAIRDFPKFPYVDFEANSSNVDTILDKLKISKGFLTTRALTCLYEIALGLHGGTDGYIVECGTFTGVSAGVMGSALRESGSAFKPLITIDPYIWKPATLDVAFCDTYPSLELFPEYICPVLWEDLGFFEKFWRLDIRLLFLDSEHDYNHVKLQLEQCAPYVCDGGWIVVDDYGHLGMTDVVHEWLDLYDFECFLPNPPFTTTTLFIRKQGL